MKKRANGKSGKTHRKSAPDEGKVKVVNVKGSRPDIKSFKADVIPDMPKFLDFPSDPLDFLKGVIKVRRKFKGKIDKVRETLYILVPAQYEYEAWCAAVRKFDDESESWDLVKDLHDNSQWGISHSAVLNPEVEPIVVGKFAKEDDQDDWFDFLTRHTKGARDPDLVTYIGRRGYKDTLTEYRWGAINEQSLEIILPEVNVAAWEEFVGKEVKKKDEKQFNPGSIEEVSMAKQIPGVDALMSHISKKKVAFEDFLKMLESEVFSMKGVGLYGFAWEEGKKGDYFLVAKKGKKGKKEEASGSEEESGSGSEEESSEEESGSESEEGSEESGSGSEEESGSGSEEESGSGSEEESGSGSEEESSESEEGSEEESGSGSEEESGSGSEEEESEEEESEEPKKGKGKGKAAKGKAAAKGKGAKGKAKGKKGKK